MLEPGYFDRSCGISGVIDDGVTNIAIITNNFSAVANVLAVVTAKTARRIKMTDVIGVRRPIGSHLREEVSFEQALRFADGPCYFVAFLRVELCVIRFVEAVETGGDRSHGLVFG